MYEKLLANFLGYSGSNETEKWNDFYSAISKYVGNGSDPLRAICAIAVTDYFSIDNYFKIRNENRLPDCLKFIFPNVELRMVPTAKKSPINIHCIFNPNIADCLEFRFFSHLKFEYNNSSYGATRAELINRSNDGVSGLANLHSDYFQGDISQLEATRRAVYQFADMIYSSNQKDINYFLGEGKDDVELVKRKCGSLMPCIHGSDAHCNDRIFTPDDGRFCWIKADVTFEGLKQILYEPKERVRICSTFPDSKPSYYVIDRVEISGNNDFAPEPIYMSDKLTCIIGGKSTGKSLLLCNIAMALDCEQVFAKERISKTNVREVVGLKVFWNDGVCSTDDIHRKIVYIPQTYLNKLSDEDQVTTGYRCQSGRE